MEGTLVSVDNEGKMSDVVNVNGMIEEAVNRLIKFGGLKKSEANKRLSDIQKK